MIVYSPITGEVLTDAIKFQPRTAFIMTQLGGKISQELKDIRREVSVEFKARNIKAVDASFDVAGKRFFKIRFVNRSWGYP